MAQNACPLCQTSAGEVVWRQPLGPALVETILCPGCGLVRHQPILGESDRRRRGQSHGQWHTNEPINQRHRQRVEHRVRRQIDFLAPEIQPGWRALEIGVGLGLLSHWLQEQGCQVLGVEPDAQQAAYARNQFGLQVLPTRFEEAALPSGFHLFAASHVIEHLADPLAFLARLRALAAPEAVLFLETPNILAPKVSPRRVFSLPHNYYFSPATLSACLRRSGWRPKKIRLFKRDSFQILAQAAASENPTPTLAQVAEVRRAIYRHRWSYYLGLYFLWRKLPWWRDSWMYRFRDYLVG